MARQRNNPTLTEALAAGYSLRAASQLAGVSEKTASRRLTDPDFRQEVNRIRSEMIERGLGRLSDAVASAGNTLRKLLKSDSAMARLGAARAILDYTCQLRENVEFEQRLAAVEEQLRAQRKTS